LLFGFGDVAARGEEGEEVEAGGVGAGDAVDGFEGAGDAVGVGVDDELDGGVVDTDFVIGVAGDAVDAVGVADAVAVPPALFLCILETRCTAANARDSLTNNDLALPESETLMNHGADRPRSRKRPLRGRQ
jgi:hypothetical protein